MLTIFYVDLWCIKSVMLNFSVGFTMIGGHFPAWVLTLILGIILAAVVFFTSKNEEQPKYHAVSFNFLDTLKFKHPVNNWCLLDMNNLLRIGKIWDLKVQVHITKTCLYNCDPIKPHFYIVKLGFTGAYIIFYISIQNIDCGYWLEPPCRGGSNEYPQSMFWAEIWKISEFLSENFLFLEVKFSI